MKSNDKIFKSEPFFMKKISVPNRKLNSESIDGLSLFFGISQNLSKLNTFIWVTFSNLISKYYAMSISILDFFEDLNKSRKIRKDYQSIQNSVFYSGH